MKKIIANLGATLVGVNVLITQKTLRWYYDEIVTKIVKK